MARNKIIKSQSQENWDNLILELNYIYERLNLIENQIIILKNASNSNNVTFGALLKLFTEKQIITYDEMNKMSTKIIKDLKKQSKKSAEKYKKEDEKILYDTLLKSDIGGNA
jgi:hypothetical protein